MGPADVIILAVVLVLLALGVRSIVRGKASNCSSCGSASTCSAHATGEKCPAARDMLRRAESALRK